MILHDGTRIKPPRPRQVHHPGSNPKIQGLVIHLPTSRLPHENKGLSSEICNHVLDSLPEPLHITHFPRHEGVQKVAHQKRAACTHEALTPSPRALRRRGTPRSERGERCLQSLDVGALTQQHERFHRPSRFLTSPRDVRLVHPL